MIEMIKQAKWQIIISAVWLTIAVGLFYFKFNYNRSPSLPYTLFVVNSLNKDVHTGDLVAFKAPDTAFADNKAKPDMVKIVLGTVGDRVTTDGENVYVTRVIPLKKYSLMGRALQPIGDIELSDEEYFVFTPHEDSYDSRYAEIGIVSTDQIIGKAWGF